MSLFWLRVYQFIEQFQVSLTYLGHKDDIVDVRMSKDFVTGRYIKGVRSQSNRYYIDFNKNYKKYPLSSNFHLFLNDIVV